MSMPRWHGKRAILLAVPKIEDLSSPQRQAVLNFPCFEPDNTPFCVVRKPLRQIKLALVTTAGLHLRGDSPFTSGDQSYRIIPSDTPPKDIIQTHNSIGFDRTPMYRDINISFPINRIRELVELQVIGSTTKHYYSFMGAQTNPKQILNETGPAVARLLLEEGADAALLTPT
jgi:D-proline reductase (dithiol) PrdB